MFFLFFFNDTATTEIYTLSLHDALPIFLRDALSRLRQGLARNDRGDGRLRLRLFIREEAAREAARALGGREQDRKSTRLNSSHSQISYGVFCLENKNTHGSAAGLSLRPH